MIISGYQGVGKSTLAESCLGFIDLESSSFFVDGVRPDNWYVMYCKVAEHLSCQGYDVFVSSHAVVRDYLAHSNKEKLVVVFPSLGLKSKWLKRLKARYNETQSDKDYKALKNAEQMYEDSINELAIQAGFEKVMLTDVDYNLKDILQLSRRGIHTEGNSFVTFR